MCSKHMPSSSTLSDPEFCNLNLPSLEGLLWRTVVIRHSCSCLGKTLGDKVNSRGKLQKIVFTLGPRDMCAVPASEMVSTVTDVQREASHRRKQLILEGGVVRSRKRHGSIIGWIACSLLLIVGSCECDLSKRGFADGIKFIRGHA